MQDSTTPRVSGTEDGDLTPADLEQIDREFGIAANTPPMNRYWVRLSRAGVVERQYEALAPDSLAAATDAAMHANGAKVDVMSRAAWDELCAVEADLALNRAKKRPEFMREWIDRKGWEQDMRAAWGPR